MIKYLIKSISMQRCMSCIFNINFIFDNKTVLTKFKVKALIAMVFGRNQWSPSTKITNRMLKNSCRVCDNF